MLPIANLPVQPAPASASVAQPGIQQVGSPTAGQPVLLSAAPVPGITADPGQGGPSFAMLLPGELAISQADTLLALPAVAVPAEPAAGDAVGLPLFALPAEGLDQTAAADEETLALLAALVAGTQPDAAPPPVAPETGAGSVEGERIAGLIASWQAVSGWMDPSVPMQAAVSDGVRSAAQPVASALPSAALPVVPPLPSAARPAVDVPVTGATRPATSAPVQITTAIPAPAAPLPFAADSVPAVVAGPVLPTAPPSVPLAAPDDPLALPATAQTAAAAAPVPAGASALPVDPTRITVPEHAAERAADPVLAQVVVSTALPRPAAHGGLTRRLPETDGAAPASASAPVAGGGGSASAPTSAALDVLLPVQPPAGPATAASAAGMAQPAAQSQEQAVPVGAVAIAPDKAPIVPAVPAGAATPSIQAQDLAPAVSSSPQSQPQLQTTAEPAPAQDAFGDLISSQRSGPATATARTEQASAPRSEPNPMERAVANQVSRAIIQHLPDGGTRMVMRLTPPELGTVRVEFVIRDGTMTARLLAEDDGVRQALDRALPQIRSDVRSEHPTLDITVDRSDQRQSWQDSQARQDQRGEQQAGGQQRHREGDEVFSLEGAEPVPVVQPQRAERALGGRVGAGSVDAFA